MRNRTLFLSLLCGLMISPLAAAPDKPAAPADMTDAAKPIKALFICGGCCHEYGKQKELITQGISARSSRKIDWTISHDPTTERDHKASVYANPEWWKGYDIIVHDECYGFVTDVPFVEGIVKAHEAGV